MTRDRRRLCDAGFCCTLVERQDSSPNKFLSQRVLITVMRPWNQCVARLFTHSARVERRAHESPARDVKPVAWANLSPSMDE